MSTMRCCSTWNLPIGTPNCLRVLQYSTVVSLSTFIAPIASAESAAMPSSVTCSTSFNPLSTWPTASNGRTAKLATPPSAPRVIAATIELAKHYNPDMAFFLAIAPWPYAELYPQLEPYVATKDYRKYNLVEPVVKPKNMTLQELERDLDLEELSAISAKA